LTIRERTEQFEADFLSPYASHANKSLGRDKEIPECDIRTVYQRDRDRIIHCKAFRRLKHKTQVFLAPEGDHYRTRLTHTLEVSQIARTIAKALRMNEDLAEAIALGHDLGHTPFGHCGEDTLNKLCPDGFEHCEQSVRIVEVLEHGGEGLNLTKEVRDGILNHRSKGIPSTLEGRIVQLSDKMAYINHDIDDAIRAGILTENALPKESTDILGHSVHDRLNNLIHNVISNSYDKDYVMLDETFDYAMKNLRKFMFSHLYKDSVAKLEEAKAKGIIEGLYEYYIENPDAMPADYFSMVLDGKASIWRAATDYVAGMTDEYAIHKYTELFVPKSWKY